MSKFHCGESENYRDNKHIKDLGIAKGVGETGYGSQTDNEPENEATAKLGPINCFSICRQLRALKLNDPMGQ